MRRLPIWILCLSLAYAVMVPARQAAAQVGFTLRIGDRYRGPDLRIYSEPSVVAIPGRAGVYYVQDSDYDVYRYNDTWYLNYNGDWYRANTYRGPWTFVGYRSVPEVVYTVPPRYRRGWTDYRDSHYDWSRADTYSDNNSGAAASVTLRIGDRYRGPDLGFYEEPDLYPVRGRSGVYYVRGSSQDVYRYGDNWYLNYNGDWYRASSYRGPWIFVGYRSVPRQVYTVSGRYRRNWRDYRDRHYVWRDSDRQGRYSGTFTLRIGDRYRGPNLGFYDMPDMIRIPGRGVYYVTDSNYDVYRYGNYWYMNYSGDWYRASSYRGPWIFVGYRSVPSDVYTVPPRYRRGWSDYRDQHYYGGTSSGDTRYSSFTLRIGDRYRGPDLGFNGQPRVVAVPGGRGVYYVEDSDVDVYRYGDTWYMNYNGDWYRADGYDGPWIFVGYRSVPRGILYVPTNYRNWTDYRDRHYDWDSGRD